MYYFCLFLSFISFFATFFIFNCFVHFELLYSYLSFVFEFYGLVSMFDIFKSFAILQMVLSKHVKHTSMPRIIDGLGLIRLFF